jgi:3',5'-cyclic AMP phosphodiesterase CpdA
MKKILACYIFCAAFLFNFVVYADTGDPEVLTIIQLTDTHIDLVSKDKGKRMISRSSELLENAVTRINNMDADLVVFSGDSINIPIEDNLIAFTKIASRLKHPWYVVLGNHDVYHTGGLTKNKFYEIVNRINPYEHNKLPYFSFVPKPGFLVIIMDGVIDGKVSSKGCFPPKELEWLEGQLKSNKESKVIIVQHFPLVEPTADPGHEVINKKEYFGILGGYPNVVAVLSGHYHREKVIKKGNITHISAPPLVQLPSKITVVTIDGDNSIATASFIPVTQD